MKYVSPVCEIIEYEVSDVITSSGQFGITKDDENDNVEFSVPVENIFGY